MKQLSDSREAVVLDVLDPAARSIAGPELTGFRQFAFGASGIAHQVYYAGERSDPPLIVMPEIAGMSPGLILFAERLVAARFQVFLPWLFGPFRERAPFRNVVSLCISREFAHLRAGTSAPIAAWLRKLADHVSEHCGGSNVGAIGMCLTGAFVIPLIIDPRVVAAVAAQPSVPCSLLFAALGIREPQAMRGLNVSAEEIAQARQRLDAGEAQLLAVRCRADRICPAEKFARLREEFPRGMTVREYGEPASRNCLGDRPHATFTKEYRIALDAAEDHWSRQSFADLVAFFEQHLRMT